jgi:hypothetical protein
MLVWCRPIQRRAAKLSEKGTNAGFEFFGGCRVRSCTTTRSWRWRASSGMAPASARGSSVNCSPTICSPPGKGNDKGKVEGLVGYTRRNFLVPIPHAAGFAEFNAELLECCRRR